MPTALCPPTLPVPRRPPGYSGVAEPALWAKLDRMRGYWAQLYRRHNPFSHAESTSELVERGIAVVFGALRSGLTVQIALTIPAVQYATPLAPWLTWFTVAVVGYCAAYVAAVLRMRGVTLLWGLLDLVVGVVSLFVCAVTLSASVGSWTNWAPALLNQVAAFIPAWCRRARYSVAIGAALGILYFVTMIRSGATDLLSVLENALTMPMFTIAAAAFGAYCRSVALQADENRREAIRLAAELELADYRFHMHNATGLLAQLARAETQPELLPSLRRQAGEEANRLRNQLQHSRLGGDDGHDGYAAGVTVGSIVWAATAGFGHLPLDLPIALGKNATMTQKQGLALQSALVALLYNVQFHANASEVTIHADELEGQWEVTLADDGVGFDQSDTKLGFGLQSQVLDSLVRNNMEVILRSNPGEGTCVTIRGLTLT